MPPKLTQKEVSAKIRSLHQGEYILLGEYLGAKYKIDLEHIPCGTRYQTQSKNFTDEGGGTCPKCRIRVSSSTKKISEEEFVERLIEKKPGYTYIEGFINMNSKVRVLHEECGNEFESSPKMMLGVKNTGCPICASSRRGSHLREKDYLGRIINEAFDGCDYSWMVPYTGNNKELHMLKHLKCGNEFDMRPNDFQQNYRCPKCGPEEMVAVFIEANGIPFGRETVIEGCKYVNTLRFDFSIWFEDDTVILIEIDGSQHFRDSAFGMRGTLHTRELRDQVKDEFCADSGGRYKLYRISYKENTLQRVYEILRENGMAVSKPLELLETP